MPPKKTVKRRAKTSTNKRKYGVCSSSNNYSTSQTSGKYGVLGMMRKSTCESEKNKIKNDCDKCKKDKNEIMKETQKLINELEKVKKSTQRTKSQTVSKVKSMPNMTIKSHKLKSIKTTPTKTSITQTPKPTPFSPSELIEISKTRDKKKFNDYLKNYPDSEHFFLNPNNRLKFIYNWYNVNPVRDREIYKPEYFDAIKRLSHDIRFKNIDQMFSVLNKFFNSGHNWQKLQTVLSESGRSPPILNKIDDTDEALLTLGEVDPKIRKYIMRTFKPTPALEQAFRQIKMLTPEQRKKRKAEKQKQIETEFVKRLNREFKYIKSEKKYDDEKSQLKFMKEYNERKYGNNIPNHEWKKYFDLQKKLDILKTNNENERKALGFKYNQYKNYIKDSDDNYSLKAAMQEGLKVLNEELKKFKEKDKTNS